MDLMQLEMFVAVAEEHNFHKAAERVFRTQSAVSIALRKLEEQIGTRLVDRSDRHAYVLTDAGEMLYDYAKRLLNLRDEALSALDEVHRLRSGRIRIGANESGSLYLLPTLIQLFNQHYPNITVEVFRRPSARLPRELRERRLDLAILSFRPEERDLEARLIWRDELILIASPQHRLARRQRVHLADLATESFITYHPPSASYEKIRQAFQQSQTPLRVSLRIESVEMMKRLVARNVGLGFAPRMCVQKELAAGELLVVLVDDFRPQHILWLARRRTDAPAPAVQAFMQVIGSPAEDCLACQ